MIHTDAYINFDGNCKEAMNFYAECLSAKVDLMLVSQSPMAAQLPETEHDKVLHSRLFKDDKTLFMAADTMMREPQKVGENVSLCVWGDMEDVKNTYEKLSEGAQILQKLTEEFFGMYGELKDKFGIIWKFQADSK